AFPEIGLAAASAPDPAPAIPRMGAVVLVELDLASRNWQASLDRAAAAGQPLDVRFTLPPAGPGSADPLHSAVAALAGRDAVRVAAFQQAGVAQHVSDREAVDRLRAALAAVGADIPVIGG